jgi:acetyl-CoA acetyltransferase
MSEAFIWDAIRTPIGRFNGASSSVRTDDVATIPLGALIERNRGVDWETVNDVIATLASILRMIGSNATAGPSLSAIPWACQAPASS